MKSSFVFLYTLCAISNTCFAEPRAPNVDIAGNKARAIAGEENREKALAFFDEIQAVNDWALVGGIGPWDKVYVTTLALGLFKPLLKWDTAAAKEIIPNPTSEIQKWLAADVRSDATMLEMLTSDSCVARRIALDKIKNGRALSPDILSRIREMVQNDDFLIINRRPLIFVDDGQHGYAQAFSAPLRRDGSLLLAEAGEKNVSLKFDEEKIAIDGLAWLGREYFAREADRRWIFEALNRLDPITPAIVDAKRRARDANSPEEQLALFRSFTALKR